MKYWKIEMAKESAILSDLFQFATHQQIIVLRNNLYWGSIEEY